MQKDMWHYPRTELAQKVINMFDIGLSSALTYFAPRRMGKTEFLRKDVMPVAKKEGWMVHYFSFLDAGEDVQNRYCQSLLAFASQEGAIKQHQGLLSKITKIGGQAGSFKAEVELGNQTTFDFDIQTIVERLGQHKKSLLLLDEVQALASSVNNGQFLAGLRTALDINKDKVKVIFTGSSREELRQMFSRANAPFFHFGQNFDFPSLDKDFTDHLADVHHQATYRTLDKDMLWQTFNDLDLVPQLIRSVVERLALNPNLNIDDAKQQILEALFSDREYVKVWNDLSSLEQLLLVEIASDAKSLYGKASLAGFANHLGVEALKISTIQSSLRTLERKKLIVRSTFEYRYVVADPNFRSWLNDFSPESSVL